MPPVRMASKNILILKRRLCDTEEYPRDKYVCLATNYIGVYAIISDRKCFILYDHKVFASSF